MKAITSPNNRRWYQISKYEWVTWPDRGDVFGRVWKGRNDDPARNLWWPNVVMPPPEGITTVPGGPYLWVTEAMARVEKRLDNAPGPNEPF